MLTTAFITAGAYLAGSGTKIMDSKYEELNTQNDKLNTELFQKNIKINSLEQDIVELKKQKYLFFFNMCVCLCEFTHTVCMQKPLQQRRTSDSPSETWVTDGYSCPKLCENRKPLLTTEPSVPLAPGLYP